jgi:hypothetical protein
LQVPPIKHGITRPSGTSLGILIEKEQLGVLGVAVMEIYGISVKPRNSLTEAADPQCSPVADTEPSEEALSI